MVMIFYSYIKRNGKSYDAFNSAPILTTSSENTGLRNAWDATEIRQETGEVSQDKRITEGDLCWLRLTFWECVLCELMIVLPQQTENK